jgi:hypothetical protein
VDTGIFALSLGGVLAAGLAAVGVLFHSKPLLAAYLVYIFGTLAFCVIYHVLQIGLVGSSTLLYSSFLMKKHNVFFNFRWIASFTHILVMQYDPEQALFFCVL